jgi:peptidyl-prolyl cis-trans isomerase A (cyclophilin A)
MQRCFLILLAIIFAACSSSNKNPRIEIQTSVGDIEVELYADKAQKSVAAFLSYVDSGFYENTHFYRVLTDQNQPSDAFKSNLIQGGLWRTGRRKSLPGIQHEPTNQTGLSHLNGVISLARREPGTATTEFFICIGDQPGYDYGGENNPDKQGYAAFGKVVKGMGIVNRIYHMNEYDQYFDPPVRIYNIRRK